MAYLRLFDDFSKRKNSTARPVANTGHFYDFEISFKEATDRDNPTILLKLGPYIPTVNAQVREWLSCYCAIDFNNHNDYQASDFVYNDYYWIVKSTIISDELIELDLEIDYLATYQAGIYNQRNVYCQRVGGPEITPCIIDDAIVTSPECERYIDLINPMTPSNGIYILGVIQADTYQTPPHEPSFRRGSVKYYTCTQSELQTLIDRIDDPVGWPNDYIPMDHIVYCKYLPFTIAFPGVATTDFMFMANSDYGYTWSHTKYSFASTGMFNINTTSINIRNHPQSANDKFLNFAPYSNYIYKAGPFGDVELDRQKIGASSDHITGNIEIDLASGDGYLRVYAYDSDNNPTLIGERRASVMIDTLLTKTVTITGSEMMALSNARESMITGAISNLGAGAIAAGMMGPVAGVAALAKTAVDVYNADNALTLQAYNAAKEDFSVISSNGTMIITALIWGLESKFYLARNLNIHNIIGRPYCSTPVNTMLSAFKKSTNYTGYVQCSGASVDISRCTPSGLTVINNFLNNGIWLED